VGLSREAENNATSRELHRFPHPAGAGGIPSRGINTESPSLVLPSLAKVIGLFELL
jgi:hypothetical protein